jgi:hypothetical protein
VEGEVGDIYVLVEVEYDGVCGCLGGDVDEDLSGESEGLEVCFDCESIVLHVSRCLKVELDGFMGTYLGVDIGGKTVFILSLSTTGDGSSGSTGRCNITHIRCSSVAEAEVTTSG